MSEKELDVFFTEEAERRWENLPPNDDFIFSKLMRNQEICKEVLELLLDIKIDHIEYPEEQKSIRIEADAKSVRLDVYVEGSEETVYNIEMQTAPQRYLAKRSRYYQGMIDLNLIEKGELYDRLKTSYVIFICTFDPFKENKSMYRFENLCIDNPRLKLNDITYKYFFNTKGKDKVSKELRQLLDIFENKFPGNNETSLAEKIRKELERIKTNKEWKVEYMTLYLRDQENIRKGYEEGMQQGITKGMQQGIQQGITKGMKKGETKKAQETALNMYKKGYTEDVIADLLEADVNTVKEWLSSHVQ